MDTLFRVVDSFLPSQFYRWKKTPKAVPATLRFVGIAVMCVGMAVFAALMKTQSDSYTTETTIQVSDISNSEWTCSMASVVTQSVTLNSSSEPTQYYNLMNVNELKSDCLSALQATDPCSDYSAILFTSGETYTEGGIVLVSSTPANALTDSVFYFSSTPSSSNDLSVASLKTFKYDASTGILLEANLGSYTIYNYPVSEQMYASCSSAMSKNGAAVFVGYPEGSSEWTLFGWEGGEATYCADCQSVLITNDNHFHVYTLTNEYVEGVGYSHEVDNILYNNLDFEFRFFHLSPPSSFTTGNFTVEQFAIFNVNTTETLLAPPLHSLYIYCLINKDVYLYRNNNGTILFESTHLVQVTAIQVSALENKVFAMVLNTTLNSVGYVHVISIDAQGHVVQYPLSFVSSGPDYLTSFAIVLNETQIIYNNGLEDANTLNMHNLSNPDQTSPLVSGFTGSISGWFTCGDSLETDDLPTNIYESACVSNGVSWQQEYQDIYYTTEPLFMANAVATAASQCNASLYSTICDRVGNLPPYICSRRVYLPFFTVFATAIANAHLLTVLLFMGAGYVLGKTNKAEDEKMVEDRLPGVEMNPISDAAKIASVADKN